MISLLTGKPYQKAIVQKETFSRILNEIQDDFRY